MDRANRRERKKKSLILAFPNAIQFLLIVAIPRSELKTHLEEVFHQVINYGTGSVVYVSNSVKTYKGAFISIRVNVENLGKFHTINA